GCKGRAALTPIAQRKPAGRARCLAPGGVNRKYGQQQPLVHSGEAGSRTKPGSPLARGRTDCVKGEIAIWCYAVIRSISAKSSGENVQPAARTFCSTCSGVVAPAMTLATTPSRNNQFNASSRSVWPRRAANASSSPTKRQLRSLAKRCACSAFFDRRDPDGSVAPRLYLPVSIPLASGKYGNIDNPNACAVGLSSRSMSRTSRLYSSWQDTNAARPCRRATSCASTICCADRFEQPI